LRETILLRRYWLNFEKSPAPTPLNMGCGVAAYDYGDAVALVQDRVFRDRPMSKIVSCIEDVNVSQLDAKHVRPNIGKVLERGIWFPLAY
jgi:hypothetical protein